MQEVSQAGAGLPWQAWSNGTCPAPQPQPQPAQTGAEPVPGVPVAAICATLLGLHVLARHAVRRAWELHGAYMAHQGLGAAAAGQPPGAADAPPQPAAFAPPPQPERLRDIASRRITALTAHSPLAGLQSLRTALPPGLHGELIDQPDAQYRRRLDDMLP